MSSVFSFSAGCVGCIVCVECNCSGVVVDDGVHTVTGLVVQGVVICGMGSDVWVGVGGLCTTWMHIVMTS